MKKKWLVFSVIFLFGLGFGLSIFAQISEQGEVKVNALVPAPEEEIPPAGAVLVPSDLIPPTIYEIEVVDITFNSARINWKTNELAIAQINYGKTSDYERTYIGRSFSTSNSILLENLSANTVYHYEIVAIDRAGNRASSGDRTFKTLSLPDIIPPANVSDFEAIPGDRQITLTWQNPPDLDFKAVKIMRSTDFYPVSPEEGILVYDGKGTSFVDTGLTKG
jgi:hypothetical protein